MKCSHCGEDMGMKNPVAIAEVIHKELEEGMSWHMIARKYFVKMDTRAGMDYNNAIIESLNKLLPDDAFKITPYQGMFIDRV